MIQCRVIGGATMSVLEPQCKHGLGPAERGLGADHPFGSAQRRDVGGEGARICRIGAIAEEAQSSCRVRDLQSGHGP